MGYENAITKFRSLYRRVERKEVLDELQRISGDLNIYVHSPFCASICKFCYYKGVKFDPLADSPLYEKFYDDYLPRVVAPFAPLIESNNVRNYFFGGGTPSLMRAETMQNVFGLFPGIKSTTSKTFEIHPALWNEDQLDVLAEFNFNTAIIGVQSFNQSVLNRQNRIHAPLGKVKLLSKALKERDIHVAIDVIYRMDSIEAESVFERDLDQLKEVDYDIVSLQHNYNERSDEEGINSFYSIIEASGILDTHQWEYCDLFDYSNQQLPSTSWKMGQKCLRLVRRDINLEVYRENIFPFTSTIDEISKSTTEGTKNESVLGFGSYRNPTKNTFSNLIQKNRVIEFIEINNDWRPEYYVVYEQTPQDTFKDTCDLFEKLKSIGKLPDGMEISVLNMKEVEQDDQIYRKPRPKIYLSLRWQQETKETATFIQKACENFPSHIKLKNELRVTS